MLDSVCSLRAVASRKMMINIFCKFSCGIGYENFGVGV